MAIETLHIAFQILEMLKKEENYISRKKRMFIIE